MAPATTTGGGIPRTIHQIWIGSNPRPEEWVKTVREFAAAHQYEYKLWDEAAAATLPWDSVPGLKKLYDDFGDEIPGKADVIRYLLLHTYGGIYIDADMVILKGDKFAAFLESNPHPIFFAWEELKRNGKTIKHPGPELQGRDERLIANSYIATQAGHPFMKAILDGIVEHANVREAGEQAWRRVGPLYITRVYWAQKAVGAKGIDQVHMYPMELFYPRYWHGITDPEMHKKIEIPKEGMLFQYGYSTNGLAGAMKRRATGGGRRSRGRRRLRRGKTRALRFRASNSAPPRRTRRIRR